MTLPTHPRPPDSTGHSAVLVVVGPPLGWAGWDYETASTGTESHARRGNLLEQWR